MNFKVNKYTVQCGFIKYVMQLCEENKSRLAFRLLVTVDQKP